MYDFHLKRNQPWHDSAMKMTAFISAPYTHINSFELPISVFRLEWIATVVFIRTAYFTGFVGSPMGVDEKVTFSALNHSSKKGKKKLLVPCLIFPTS